MSQCTDGGLCGLGGYCKECPEIKETMTDQDKKEQRRKAARERKRKERARKAEHKKACGAHTINFELYRGTRKCLDELMEAGGFTEQGELFTLLLHGVHREMLRDKSRFEELIKV